MKHIKYFVIALGLAAVVGSGCSGDLLNVESKTAATSDYLYSTSEGLQKAVVGLYDIERELVVGDNSPVGIPILLDASTDLVLYRGGTTASLFRLDNNTSSTGYFKTYWTAFYTIIGKSNEIIEGAKKLGLEDPDVARVYGEASLLRARAYFLLYQRFERLYINTEPTTVDNAFGRTFRAAGRSEIFDLIKQDLAVAIDNLPWTPVNGTSGTPESGRMTRAIAKHVRAQVAMWEEDWSEAITQCESIFTEGGDYYKLLKRAIDAFTGAELTNSEILYAFQFSANPGGGGSVSGGVVTGHRLSLNTTPNYNKISGMKWSVENGGYGWGRVYPNSYLLGLYDQEKDKRYTELFRHHYYYNDADNLPKGKALGDEVSVTASQYLEQAHPMSMKYFDQWTNADEPSRTSSFKDIVVYRLAETYLMAAEAYFHRDGGSSAKALEYYNATYVRAGNTAETSLTLDKILDEYARELYFEGVRWNLLKRLGLLGERVRLHSGDTKTEDPRLNQNYTQARTNFSDARDYRWPIPQDELDLMPGFGQNQGW